MAPDVHALELPTRGKKSELLQACCDVHGSRLKRWRDWRIPLDEIVRHCPISGVGEDESGGKYTFPSKNSLQRTLIRKNSLPCCSPRCAWQLPSGFGGPTTCSRAICGAAPATGSGSPRKQRPDDASSPDGRPGSAGHGGSLRARTAGDAQATTGRRVLATGDGCPRPSLAAGTPRRCCHSSSTRRSCAR